MSVRWKGRGVSSPIDLTDAVWQKSSYSGANGDCVEVANMGDVVAVRDSKNAEGPKLVFSAADWAAFLGRMKAGDFDTRP
ncbi:DUF397 domain-containing protein [Streptosporangium sp. CA-135522]|uniref:DUF397 domain-containing protein n=1 Tax=Streptosporangium sp. CA-135522 TaxID=3240072 RepID=UPI003D9497DA